MIILAPFAYIYKLITTIRNKAYDSGRKQVYLPSIPTLLIGNLSTGGTGKTPHTAWIIQQFYHKYKMVTLSRGYKRKTKGFICADEYSDANVIGDEPMEYVTQFPNLSVCVGENRAAAAQQIEQLIPDARLLLLDDAYQHRAIRAHLQILLTTYQNPFYNDFVLPRGRLRESKSGYTRANYIIVTKCPLDLKTEEQERIIDNIRPLAHQKVLFSTYKYKNITNLITGSDISVEKQVVLISGIANNKPLIHELERRYGDIIAPHFSDHYDFKETTVKQLLAKYPKQDYQIILTRKDAVKWLLYPELINNTTIGVLDIEVQFITPPNTLLHDIEQLIQNKKK